MLGWLIAPGAAEIGLAGGFFAMTTKFRLGGLGLSAVEVELVGRRSPSGLSKHVAVGAYSASMTSLATS